MDTVETLLEDYGRPSERGYRLIEEAAADPRLPTTDLLRIALEDERAERASDVELMPSMALIILHERADEKSIEHALSSLQHEDPARRQLGARLLREFGHSNAEPLPHVGRAVEALKAMIDVEHDEEVLWIALSCLGWKGGADAEPVLLRFARDERFGVRWVVANNLLCGVGDGRPLPDEVATALARLATDEDADICWSVAFDVAESPELFDRHRELFEQALRTARVDSPEEDLPQIDRALRALETGQPQDE